jgi:drug/metabolite transporter (DMT)-like permease
VTRTRLTPLLLAAFAAVYLIWGSTYLAIRLAIDTIPPLLMAGVRFLVAGAILFPIAYWSGDRQGDRLTPAHWRAALVVGALLLTGSNGVITFAEQHVASGVVALLVATTPMWMAAFAHFGGRQRVSRLGVAGVVAGLVGVGLMLRPGSLGAVPPLWIAFTLLSPLCWAAGSVYAQGAPMPRRPLLVTATQMLCGGALLCLVAAAAGEWGQLHLSAITLTSLAGFAYLVVAGSLVGYTAYMYVLGRVSPRAASSYAYVNPLVAVLLGWAFLGENVATTTLVAGALIVVAVVVLLAGDRRPAPSPAKAGCAAGGEPELA